VSGTENNTEYSLVDAGSDFFMFPVIPLAQAPVITPPVSPGFQDFLSLLDSPGWLMGQ